MPAIGSAPSATTTIEANRPLSWRRISRPHNSSTSNGNLGNQHRRCAAGNSCMRCDPPGVPAHDLDQHDPIVALGRGVQAVDRIRCDLHRRGETEREVGSLDVVVDRLRNAENREPVFTVQTACDRQAAVAADHDQPVEPEVTYGLLHVINTVRRVERAPSPGAQHRASTRQHSAHRIDRERCRPPIAHPIPGIEEPDHLVAVTRSPFRTAARMTALSPGQSPPPVRIPTRTGRDRSGAAIRPGLAD